MILVFRYIELQNGIRMLLVSNTNSQLSGAALDIKVGSFYDPVHLQGLCHLCEHVLFTGSEQYPNDSYSSFLAQRGGSSNAFTSSEHTNFHFDIPSEHFSEALQRFISFFTHPIFRQTSVKNELETIQSEHEKNRYNDVWRTNQVRSMLILLSSLFYDLIYYFNTDIGNEIVKYETNILGGTSDCQSQSCFLSFFRLVRDIVWKSVKMQTEIYVTNFSRFSKLIIQRILCQFALFTIKALMIWKNWPSCFSYLCQTKIFPKEFGQIIPSGIVR